MNLSFLRSIRTHMIMLVLVSILPAFAIILYTGMERNKHETEYARSSALRIAENFAFEHERVIESTRQSLATLSKIPEILDLNPTTGRGLLAELLKQNPVYGNIIVLDAQGKINISARPSRIADRSSAKYFKDVVRTRNFSIGEYTISEALKRPALHLAYPILGDRNQLRGVITVSIDIARYADRFSRINLSSGSILTVSDYKGMVLFRHPSQDAALPKNHAPERIAGSGRKAAFTETGSDGVKYLTTFKSLSLSGEEQPYTFIRISIPEKEALYEARISLFSNLFLLGAGFLLALMIARALGNAAVVKRLNQLVRASRKLGQGDLNARTGLDYKKGELGELARAFDEMADAVESKRVEALEAETKSRRAAEEWIMTFDSITDPVMITNPDFSLIRFNQAAVRFLNLPPGRIPGENCFRLMHGTEKPPEFCPVHRMVETKRHEEAECYDAGRGAWLHLSADPILDETGKIAGIIHTVKDISDRKKNEELLRVSEGRYRSIFNESPVALLEINGSPMQDYIDRLRANGVRNFREYFEKNGTDIPSGPALLSISDANRAALDLYQVLNREELRQDLANASSRDLQRVLKESLMAVAEGVFEYESDVVIATFKEKPLHIHLRWTVPPESRKHRERVLVSILDITDRKRAEEIIRNQRLRLQSILENAPFGIIILDRFGKGTYGNSKYREIFGYDNEFPDWETWSVQAYPDPEHRKRVAAQWWEALKKAKPGEKFISYMQAVTCRDGSKKDTMITCVLLGSHEVLFIMEDVTERKRLESQLMQSQKMQAVGTLAGGIAHDFNNLLMTILGYTSLILMDTKPEDPRYEQLKIIEGQVQSGSGLTKQLLGFARGGKYEIRVFDLNELLDRSADMFGRTKKEITIHKKFEKDLWPVEADTGQIEQAFLNFFLNAWHAMPAGGDIFLTTSNLLLDEDRAAVYSLKTGKYVRISITDTGIGMDEATRQRIFEPFFTTKEMGRGAGLGLASAYGIIKNHGGSITVYSEKGKGTNFNLYLPASGKTLQKISEAHQAILKGTGTILLVDDQDPVLEVGRNMLQALGYTVLVAPGGKEALSLYKEDREKIDLVVLDMIMPAMSGGETYAALKEMNPGIKVILSSGYSMNGDAVKILDRGCNGFIQKPFTLSELSLKIREVLG